MPDKQYQLKLIEETAQRLAADGNAGAASCLFNVAAAMACNYENILAQKLCKEMSRTIKEGLS